jgi:A/G-specific adenine glycosylase
VCNEALMELGATVCTPAAPRCGSCPLAGRCAARASGRAAEIPAPRKAAARRTLYWHALVDVSPDGLLIAERPATGLWARMHQPPTVESAQPLDEAALADQWGTAVRRVGAFTHVTSHRDVEFAVFVAHRAGSPTVEGARRVPLDSLESVAFSNAAWRVLECAGVPVRTPPSASAGRRAGRAGRSAPTDS